MWDRSRGGLWGWRRGSDTRLGLQTSVDFAAMGDDGYLDELARIVNPVDDPVIPDANAKEVGAAGQFSRT